MKKTLLILAVGAIALASCSSNEKAAEDSAKIAELKTQYNEATNFNDSLLLLMGDIYTGLDSINSQEGLLYSTGGAEGVDRREEIRRNLSAIKARLAANKELLEQLQARANKEGQATKVLNQTIEKLKEQISQQDAKIAELTTKLEEAHGQIDQLSEQVAKGEEDLKAANAATEEARAQAVAAENLANRVYYAIGTNKELKENGILTKKFLSATKVMEGNDINLNYFTQADKRNLTSIPTQSKKVEVKSNMPQGSYELVGEKKGPKTLKITDPAKFWSLTPYLILQVD